MAKIPETVLNSGHKMPLIGLGCATGHPPPPIEELSKIYLEAIKIGYRHFDTAACYGTEEALGRALSQAIENGLVKGREGFFITSKLWITDTDHDLVVPALKKSLRSLRLEYLDLYLVHWPFRLREGTVNILNLSKDDFIPFDMDGTWKAMEECYNLGLTKSIGVSNFTCERLSKLLESSSTRPAVNQVEMHVAWQQRKLMPFCKDKNIHVTAWSPLSSYGSNWGTNAVMENPILKDIATSKSKTVAQVALRWIHEQGSSIVVKSFKKERMIENLQIFDWEFSKKELEQIQQIPQARGFSGVSFINPEGPFKSLEELWDGDL